MLDLFGRPNTHCPECDGRWDIREDVCTACGFDGQHEEEYPHISEEENAHYAGDEVRYDYEREEKAARSSR